jgi:8-oxo-dGTP pyrophosphatase MutT (NUDIX family)
MRARFPVTVQLFFFRDQQVLLLRRFNTGFRDGEYTVPAGHIDGGEDIMVAAVREAKEEAGVDIAVNDLTFSTVMHRIEDEERIDFFFLVRAWTGEAYNAEPEKCDDLQWFDLNRLPENTVPYVRQAIGNHHAGVAFDEYRGGRA